MWSQGGEIKAGDDVKFHNDDYDIDYPDADCDNEKLYNQNEK